jgi:broad specificity phosphatase PhoE
MNRLYLVRHGENLANVTKEFSCRLVDYSLTTKGVLQSQQTAEYFRDKEIHEIFASPLKRAMETAEIIADPLGLKVVVMDNFREVDVGDLELKPPNAEAWAFHDAVLSGWLSGQTEGTFPGGENYVMLWNRVRTGIERVVAGKEGRNMVVVAHGGVFTFTLGDLCRGINVEWLRTAANQNCSITVIDVELHNGRPEGKLITWASVAHLHGAAADLVPGTPQPGFAFDKTTDLPQTEDTA